MCTKYLNTSSCFSFCVETNFKISIINPSYSTLNFIKRCLVVNMKILCGIMTLLAFDAIVESITLFLSKVIKVRLSKVFISFHFTRNHY